MAEQILAIAPILPGQKVNSGFDIPPHVSSTRASIEKSRQPNQNAPVQADDGANDLIDFGGPTPLPPPNAKAVAANKNSSSQHRTRSVSLMDDDHHVNAMNDQMGHMRLMEPTKTPAKAVPGKDKPLERTDTQTSEIDAFFDAED